MATFENWITQYEQSIDSAAGESTEWVQYAPVDQLLQFLQFVTGHHPSTPAQQRILHQTLTRLLRRAADSPLAADPQLVDGLVAAYHGLTSYADRHQFLQLVAQIGGEYALKQ